MREKRKEALLMRKYIINKEAVENAEKATREALNEYKALIETGTREERIAAFIRYKEASATWRTLLSHVI